MGNARQLAYAVGAFRFTTVVAMRTTRITSLAAALLVGSLLITGCGASDAARPTIIVTETASTGATTEAATTSEAETTTDATASASAPSESSDPTAVETSGDATGSQTSESMAPVVTVDPLKADCTKVLNPTELGKAFGQLPAGTGRLLEAANPDRQITGRLKCQYGVSEDGSAIAVQVILAQFSSQQAAETQMELTATTERQAGAKDSTTTVLGHPADVLLRDGGLLTAGYDTWTLSVVAANGVVTDDKLPAALESVAEYALNQVITNG